MIATCPKDPEHKTFITCAHVMQDWEVDERGNWLKTIDDSIQTSYPPNSGNIWTCSICGAEAVVKD